MAHRPDSLVIRSRVAAQNETRKDIFINILEKVHTVRVAIKISGMSSEMVYRWRKEDKAFAKAWDEAIEYSKDALESAAYLNLTQAYTSGRKLTMPEERLTEFMLTGMRPEKYKQTSLSVDNSINFSNTIDWTQVPDEIMAAFNAGQLTLQDVYERTLSTKQREGSTAGEDRRNEGSGAT